MSSRGDDRQDSRVKADAVGAGRSCRNKEDSAGCGGVICGRWFLGIDMLLLKKALQTPEINALDVAADRALGEGEGHPRLEVGEDFGVCVGWGRAKIVVDACPGIHELAQPIGVWRIVLQVLPGREQALAEVLPDGGFALRLRCAAQRGEVIGFDAR